MAMFPPLVDLGPFTNSNKDSHKAKQQVAQELREACHNIGFFQVKSPLLSQDDIDQAISATTDFFNLPSEVKESASAFKSILFRGYQGTTSESHSCSANAHHKPDLKESFTIGAVGTCSPMHGPNNWPDNCPPDIRIRIENYWHIIMQVALQVSKCLALALGLEEDFFVSNMCNPIAQMILLRYPAHNEMNDYARSGCGEHTDCGFLTLLVQDKDVDGLQIKDPQGNWIDAPQAEGLILCNLGDMAEQWSNGYFKSTWHRVNNMSGRQRHSIPFFCNLDYSAEVDPATSACIGLLADSVGSPKYEKVCAGDYICKKLGLMYTNKLSQ